MIAVESMSHQVSSGEDSVVILDDISFTVQSGQSVAITGSSGSGKTTLLSILAGLNTPTSGKVVIADQTISSLSEDERATFRRHYLGFVFQSFHLLSGFSALENVMLPLELIGNKEAKKRAHFLLEQVGLTHRIAHHPSQLSGGEQQRVALARAFAINPYYFFADEPTGNLDEQTGQTVIDLLFQMNAEYNTTLVLVTHEKRLAERCQRQLILAQQHINEISS